MFPQWAPLHGLWKTTSRSGTWACANGGDRGVCRAHSVVRRSHHGARSGNCLFSRSCALCHFSVCSVAVWFVNTACANCCVCFIESTCTWCRVPYHLRYLWSCSQSWLNVAHCLLVCFFYVFFHGVFCKFICYYVLCVFIRWAFHWGPQSAVHVLCVQNAFRIFIGLLSPDGSSCCVFWSA